MSKITPELEFVSFECGSCVGYARFVVDSDDGSVESAGEAVDVVLEPILSVEVVSWM